MAANLPSEAIIRRLVIQMELNDRLYRRQLARADDAATMVANRMTGRLGVAADRASLAFAGLGLAATGAIMGIVRTVMQYEKELTLASLAKGADQASVRFKALNVENQVLAKRLKQTRTEVVKLQRSIQELGVSGAAASALTLSSGQFGPLTDVEPARAAKLFFRISKTSGGRSPMERSPQLASAILRAGQSTGAGPAELTKQLEALQTIQTIGFSPAELIAFSAVMAEIDPTRRESVRTSIFRQLTTGVPQNASAFAKLFKSQGISELGDAASVKELASSDPMMLFERLATAMDNVPVEQRGGILQSLGLANQRDKVFVALLTAQLADGTDAGTKFKDTLALATKELGENNVAVLELTKQYEILSKTLTFRLQEVRNAFQSLSLSMSGSLSPAIALVFAGMTGLIETFAENKVLAFAAAIGLLATAFIGLRGAWITFHMAESLAAFKGIGGILKGGGGLRGLLFGKAAPTLTGPGGTRALGVIGPNRAVMIAEKTAKLSKMVEQRDKLALKAQIEQVSRAKKLAAVKHEIELAERMRFSGVLPSGGSAFTKTELARINMQIGRGNAQVNALSLPGRSERALALLQRNIPYLSDDISHLQNSSRSGSYLGLPPQVKTGRGARLLSRLFGSHVTRGTPSVPIMGAPMGLHPASGVKAIPRSHTRWYPGSPTKTNVLETYFEGGVTGARIHRQPSLVQRGMTEATPGFSTRRLSPEQASRFTSGPGRALGATGRFFGRSTGSFLPQRLQGFLGRKGLMSAPGQVGFKAGAGMAFAEGGVKGAAGFAGKRAVGGVLGGPIGWIITAISLLEKPFDRLGKTFAQLGESGGLIGTVMKVLAGTFNNLAIAAKIINLVFDSILALLKKIADITGLSKLWNATVNRGADAGIGGQRSLMGWLDKSRENVNAWGNGGTTVNVDMSVKENNAAMAFTTVARRTMAGTATG